MSGLMRWIFFHIFNKIIYSYFCIKTLCFVCTINKYKHLIRKKFLHRCEMLYTCKFKRFKLRANLGSANWQSFLCCFSCAPHMRIEILMCINNNADTKRMLSRERNGVVLKFIRKNSRSASLIGIVFKTAFVNYFIVSGA